MDISTHFTIFYFFIFLAHEGNATLWSNLSAETKKITTIYEGMTNLIPLQDLSKTLTVSLGMQLLAINDFDDVLGIMDISTYLVMEWTEEVYSGTYGSAAPDASVTVSAGSIWKPTLILVNAAGDTTEILQDQSQVRIYLKSGKCTWTENVVLKASCKPNVYFYPFDVHDCSVKITTRAYNSSELILSASSFQKDFFEESVSWLVKKTFAESMFQDSKSHVKFQITIARRPLNYILNYILPIVILSGLNIFVFILPRTSGERAGYSITCFLTFVVFMNTIVTSLPKSSAPVSVLVYYLTVMMTISACINVIVVLTLIIDKKIQKEKRKEEDQENARKEIKENHQPSYTNQIPSKNTKSVPTSKSKVGPTGDVNSSGQDKPKNQGQLSRCLQCLLCWVKCLRCWFCCTCCRKTHPNYGWVQIGNTIDLVCFIFFFAGELIFSIAYLTPVSQQYYVEEVKLQGV